MVRPGTRGYPVPPGVWFKTALILALAVALTTAYDIYYRYTNPYIRAVEQRIAQFKHHPDKPLVVAIGASLMMLGTPSQWPERDFDWLRLIIQGSRIDDFIAVTDSVINLKPDLIVIGLHQFIDQPYDARLRLAFKRLLRAPLETTEVIRPPPPRFDRSACGSELELNQAVDRIKEEFESPDDDVFSSSVLRALVASDIPVMIIRVPMLADIESGVSARNDWLQTVQQDIAKLGLKIHDAGWRNLGERYFCPDKIHMSEAGEQAFSAWLAPQITAELGSLK